MLSACPLCPTAITGASAVPGTRVMESSAHHPMDTCLLKEVPRSISMYCTDYGYCSFYPLLSVLLCVQMNARLLWIASVTPIASTTLNSGGTLAFVSEDSIRILFREHAWRTAPTVSFSSVLIPIVCHSVLLII